MQENDKSDDKDRKQSKVSLASSFAKYFVSEDQPSSLPDQQPSVRASHIRLSEMESEQKAEGGQVSERLRQSFLANERRISSLTRFPQSQQDPNALAVDTKPVGVLSKGGIRNSKSVASLQKKRISWGPSKILEFYPNEKFNVEAEESADKRKSARINKQQQEDQRLEQSTKLQESNEETKEKPRFKHLQVAGEYELPLIDSSLEHSSQMMNEDEEQEQAHADSSGKKRILTTPPISKSKLRIPVEEEQDADMQDEQESQGELKLDTKAQESSKIKRGSEVVQNKLSDDLSDISTPRKSDARLDLQGQSLNSSLIQQDSNNQGIGKTFDLRTGLDIAQKRFSQVPREKEKDKIITDEAKFKRYSEQSHLSKQKSTGKEENNLQSQEQITKEPVKEDDKEQDHMDIDEQEENPKIQEQQKPKEAESSSSRNQRLSSRQTKLIGKVGDTSAFSRQRLSLAEDFLSKKEEIQIHINVGTKTLQVSRLEILKELLKDHFKENEIEGLATTQDKAAKKLLELVCSLELGLLQLSVPRSQTIIKYSGLIREASTNIQNLQQAKNEYQKLVQIFLQKKSELCSQLTENLSKIEQESKLEVISQSASTLNLVLHNCLDLQVEESNLSASKIKLDIISELKSQMDAQTLTITNQLIEAVLQIISRRSGVQKQEQIPGESMAKLPAKLISSQCYSLTLGMDTLIDFLSSSYIQNIQPILSYQGSLSQLSEINVHCQKAFNYIVVELDLEISVKRKIQANILEESLKFYDLRNIERYNEEVMARVKETFNQKKLEAFPLQLSFQKQITFLHQLTN